MALPAMALRSLTEYGAPPNPAPIAILLLLVGCMAIPIWVPHVGFQVVVNMKAMPRGYHLPAVTVHACPTATKGG